MKLNFLLLVVLVTAVLGQRMTHRNAGPSVGMGMAPPIAVHDTDVLDPETAKPSAPQTVSLADMKEGDQVMIPLIGKRVVDAEMIKNSQDSRTVSLNDIDNKEQIMIPLIGKNIYDPAGKRHGDRGIEQGREHPTPGHPRGPGGEQEERLRRHERGENRPPHPGADRERPPHPWVEGERPPFGHPGPQPQFGGRPDQPQINHDDWERHIDGNHMEGSKSHKRIRCMFIGTAIVFTLVGLCLAKCCRKCRKNKQERVRAMVMRSRTASEIHEEIKSEQRKLDQLKNQYATKRAQEEHVRRQEEHARQAYEMEMRNRHMQQDRVYFAQPYPVQAYYNPRTQIPMGRPLNESTNSSFATEYPQL